MNARQRYVGLGLWPSLMLCGGCTDQLQDRASEGDADAQFALGMIYATGDGVTVNTALALDWMEKAAIQGHMRARYELGSYYTLDHPNRDFGKAAHWLRLSALQGYASARTSLGILYAAGPGVPRDFAEAFAWLSLAEELGQDPLAIESKRKVEHALRPDEFKRGLGLIGTYRDRIEGR